MKEEKPRIARLLSIITRLQSKKIITARELASSHGVSTRTIYRDIRTLEQSGIPIYTEEGRGYSFIDGFYFPPLMLNEMEVNALITAEKLIHTNGDISVTEHFNSAITKIMALIKYNQKDKAHLLSNRMLFKNQPNGENLSYYVNQIQSAIVHFRCCDMTYCSLENITTHRVIEPFAIYNSRGIWLLIAFCRLRKAFRKFRVDYIRQFLPLQEHFESHNMTLQEYFEKYG